MAIRTARTAWNGTLMEGTGQVELTSSGTGTFDTTFPKRTSEKAEGATSAEELIAAAHSVCYSQELSGQIGHPVLVAVVLLALLCLGIGLLVRTAAGRVTRRVLERRVFEQIPGYRLAKAFTGDGPLAEQGGRALRPALAAIEDGQCPALVMDELADGRLVVFVPASPAPMSGAVYVFSPDKVTYLNVPVLPFLKVISSWGLGLREIIEAQAVSQGTQADYERPEPAASAAVSHS